MADAEMFYLQKVSILTFKLLTVRKTMLVYKNKKNSNLCTGKYFRFKNFRASIWEDIHAVFGDSGVTNILKLLDLIHSLPATSVLNETGFNQMKLIKTDRRQSLSGRHLNDLMLIRLQSPSIAEFDPNPDIDRWMVS